MKAELKRYQRDFPHSYTLGVYPTIELLEYRPDQALGVILDSRGTENTGVAMIREICRQRNLEIIESDRLVEKLSRKGNTYAVGVFEKFTHKLDFSENHLVLVQPSGMGNLGTILRTMLGFDHRNLAVIEPAADIYHPRVIRASMGAFFQVQFQPFQQFTDYWGTYPDHNLYPLMTGGRTTLPEADFRPPYTLIFGDEASGLPEAYHQYGESVAIPQSEAVDSLNIALSVGISLYQAFLNRKAPGADGKASPSGTTS